MKTIKAIMFGTAVLLVATMISCSKESPVQYNGQDNISVSETISICVDGMLGEYAQENDTKSSLSGNIRVKWSAGDKVYAYDGTQCLGELTVSLKDGIDYFAVLSGNLLKVPAEGTTKITLVYSNIFTEAPAIADGKIKIDLSQQTSGTKADDIPFVAYGMLEYSFGTTEISKQIANFSFATSLMRLNCTGLEVSTTIKEAKLVGMGKECLLNVTNDGASAGQGEIGEIHLNISDISASANGAQTIYSALAKTVNSEVQTLEISQQHNYKCTFNNTVRNEGTLFNAICQMKDKRLFSVRDGEGKPVRTIIFSAGNLYYDGADWGFEKHQYDFRTYAGKGCCIDGIYNQNSGTPTGNWGLFGWVGYSSKFNDAPEKYGVSTSANSADYGTITNEIIKVDWGTVIDSKGTWRTLTNNEWRYLFLTRPNADSKVGFATVNGVHGIILLPDVTFGDPAENTSPTAIGKQFTPRTITITWDSNVYSAEGWAAMETEGAVFLPASSYRDGSNVNYVGEYGFYWSSSSFPTYTDYAYQVYFFGENVTPDKVESRYRGCSVRLVTDIN